jgi:type VI protein secretion system component Hcp
MNIRSTNPSVPKYLAALIGLAWIFGFTTHAIGGIVNYYLKIDGTNNESITTGPYAGDFPVSSFTFTGAAGSGGVAGEQTIVVTRTTDSSSPGFIAAGLAGQTYTGLTLYCVKNGKTSPLQTYTFTSCYLASVIESGITPGGDEQPKEELTFVYGAVNLTLP